MILGIDTSSTDLSVALCNGNTPVASVNRYVRNSHAEHITRAVNAVMAMGGVTAEDVKRIAVSTGPGSFTGLRIGLSFVKGFCLMTDKLVLPLSSLHVLAHAVCYQRAIRGKKVYAALDARQGRLHIGGFFCDDNGLINRITEDRLSTPGELANELTPDGILITDTMGYARSIVFGEFAGKAQIIAADNSALSRGLSCALMAARIETSNETSNETAASWQTADAVVPNYLQMSAAQEKLCR